MDVARTTPPPVADLNMDGVVNSTDSALWSDLLYSTSNASVYADSDLDFDGADDWNSSGIDGDLFYESYNANLGLSGVGRVSSPGVASRTGYAGYQWDGTLSAYHVRYRVYLPDIGRWTRRDPLGYRAGPSLYSYVFGWALRAVDSLGLQCVVTVRAKDVWPLSNHLYIIYDDGHGNQVIIRGGPQGNGGASGSSGSPSGSSGSSCEPTNQSCGTGSDASSSKTGSSVDRDNDGPSDSSDPDVDGDGVPDSWGPIDIDIMPYIPGAPDWDEEGDDQIVVIPLPAGIDCEDLLRRLRDAAMAIEREQIPYDPLGPNSNSTVRRILRDAGLPETGPDVWTPGWNTPCTKDDKPKPKIEIGEPWGGRGPKW